MAGEGLHHVPLLRPPQCGISLAEGRARQLAWAEEACGGVQTADPVTVLRHRRMTAAKGCPWLGVGPGVEPERMGEQTGAALLTSSFQTCWGP